MVSGPLLFAVLALGIAFIVIATTRWKLHPFLALLVTAYGVGLASGLGPEQALTALTGGFGRTVGAIGIVISCGCIIGTALERSGGALVLANALLRVIGEGRALLAMSCTGAIVSIPVFCDSGYVILSPLNRSLARRTGQSMAGFAVALSMGLYATHCLVPPTPGPIATAGELRADLGLVILYGLLIAVPVVFATYLYAGHVGKNLQVEPPAPGPTPFASTVPAPPAFATLAPILLPVLLIAAKSVADLPTRPSGTGALRDILGLIGNPNSALILGVFLTWFVVRRHGRATFGDWSGEGLRDAGTIILITAAGGAFGAVLRETPLAKLVGDALATLSLGRFNLVLPFIVAAGLKTSIGSSTVAMITTASLVSPLLPALGLSAGLGPVLATLAIAGGSMMVSHVNDSFFWVITQMSGLTVPQGYRVVTVASGIAGLTALAGVLVLHFILA
ncbi:DsdX permease [Lacunisphaera limnophila]|uniref:DsdX permease n=1 Tax=Lacunisphaera limnophila TaxID=1838286 RepID=A0A1D8AWS8_9BACT|nr:GntP family permease [Lacunisphaera limnophila]AOS45313.1 DsdX permease [Lacunisphaera limnophila]